MCMDKEWFVLFLVDRIYIIYNLKKLWYLPYRENDFMSDSI